MSDPFDTDPNRSTDELLLAIKAGLVQGYNAQNPNLGLAPFAALLVKLSREADKTARMVVWLTWGLFALTFALLALTAVMTYEDATKNTERGNLSAHSQTK